MTKKIKTIQLYDGKWYDVFPYEECCDCGLVHRVEYRLHKGQLQLMVYRDDKATAKARGARR